MAKEKVVLGIDIGGTNSKFGLVSRDGVCLFRESIATKAEEPAGNLFERLFEDFNNKFASLGKKYDIAGVGIGAPNTNYYKGTMEDPPNLSWGVVNLVELVNLHLDIPVAVTNDANAAALGEMKFGAAKWFKHFIQITLGTGLGSGIVVNGELVYGHDGFAGEFGHINVIPGGRKCGCGKRGCLETYASAPGLKRTVLELLADSNADTVMKEYSYCDLNAKLVYEAVLKKDKIALQAFEETGKILGKALADAVALFSPEAIILFGGLAEAGDFIFEPTKKHLEKNVLSVFRNKVKILPSGLESGEAAILGAAALIWHELESPKK